MNTVVISGRLKSDPEFKYIEDKQGKKMLMAKYTIVQSRTKEAGWKDEINFIPCVCFGRVAEIAKEYLTQGKLVTVEGRYQGKVCEDGENKSFFSNIAVRKQIFDIGEKNKAGDKDG